MTDNQLGIASLYLVMYPSRNPAEKVKGNVLIKILTPSLNPILNEVNRE